MLRSDIQHQNTLRYVEKNAITTIQSGAFSDLTSLVSLELHDSHCTIPATPAEIWTCIPTASHLSMLAHSLDSQRWPLCQPHNTVPNAHTHRNRLNNNRITSIPPSAFSSLISLESLEQSKCLPQRAISHSKPVPNRYIDENAISSLEQGTFASLNKLKTLPSYSASSNVNIHTRVLEGNSITSISSGMFAGLTLLNSLKHHKAPPPKHTMRSTTAIPKHTDQ